MKRSKKSRRCLDTSVLRDFGFGFGHTVGRFDECRLPRPVRSGGGPFPFGTFDNVQIDQNGRPILPAMQPFPGNVALGNTMTMIQPPNLQPQQQQQLRQPYQQQQQYPPPQQQQYPPPLQQQQQQQDPPIQLPFIRNPISEDNFAGRVAAAVSTADQFPYPKDLLKETLGQDLKNVDILDQVDKEPPTIEKAIKFLRVQREANQKLWKRAAKNCDPQTSYTLLVAHRDALNALIGSSITQIKQRQPNFWLNLSEKQQEELAMIKFKATMFDTMRKQMESKEQNGYIDVVRFPENEVPNELRSNTKFIEDCRKMLTYVVMGDPRAYRTFVRSTQVNVLKPQTTADHLKWTGPPAYREYLIDAIYFTQVLLLELIRRLQLNGTRHPREVIDRLPFLRGEFRRSLAQLANTRRLGFFMPALSNDISQRIAIEEPSISAWSATIPEAAKEWIKSVSGNK
jgi:hypothetical protein